MLSSLLITFREGLEAFLVVAIIMAYLVKTGRKNLLPAVYAGIVVALGVSLTTGWHVAELAENPVFEGGLALIAGALVASFTIYVMLTAKSLRGKISANVETHASKTGFAAAAGLFGFTVLMIAREGMETAMMLGALSANENATQLMFGALAGLGLTVLIGYAWVKNAHHINIKLFLQTTGVFLILFAAHLFMYGVHEMTEVEGLPFFNNETLHEVTEPFGHDSLYGQLVTYGLLAVPCLWLGYAWLKGRMFPSAPA